MSLFLWAIDASFSKLFRPFEEAPLAAGLIIGVGCGVGHAINCSLGRFAGSKLLAVARWASRLHGQTQLHEPAGGSRANPQAYLLLSYGTAS